MREAHILETDLAARDELPILACEGHLPELLGGGLVNGFRDQAQAAAHDRAEEIGVVVNADCELATIDELKPPAHAARALDSGGEGSAIDDSSWLVLLLPDVARAHDA